MQGDEGMEVKTQGVPRIGGEAASKYSPDGGSTTPVVASAHLTDGPRAEGVAYTEVPGMDVTTQGYPAGTDFGEASNPLR